MQIQQRLRIARDISEALSAQYSFYEIEGILKNASISPAADCPGTLSAYVLDSLSGASPEILLGLAHFCGIAIETGNTDPDPEEVCRIWGDSELRVFVSHISKHKSICHELSDSFLAVGVKCFVAHEDIEPDQEWEDEIRIALDTCHALVAVLTDDFGNSDWTNQEVGWAFGRGCPVFGVMHSRHPCGFMNRKQGIKFDPKSIASTRDSLLASFVNYPMLREKLKRGLLRKLRIAGSWTQAKTISVLLEKYNLLDANDVDTVSEIINVNREVRDSFGAMDVLQPFLDTFRVAKRS